MFLFLASLTSLLCPPYLEIRLIGPELRVLNAVMGRHRRFLERRLLWVW